MLIDDDPVSNTGERVSQRPYAGITGTRLDWIKSNRLHRASIDEFRLQNTNRRRQVSFINPDADAWCIRPSPSVRFTAKSGWLTTTVIDSVGTEIENSRWILDLPDDWDDQGSPKYSFNTWKRATDFLLLQSYFAKNMMGRDLPAPKILPGPAGSLDLHWKMPSFELLVNIPSEIKKAGTFYGDNYGGLCIRGNLDTSKEVAGLIVWLLT